MSIDEKSQSSSCNVSANILSDDGACCSHNLTSLSLQHSLTPTQTTGEDTVLTEGGYRASRSHERGGLCGGIKNTNHCDRDSLPTVAHSIQYS